MDGTQPETISGQLNLHPRQDALPEVAPDWVPLADLPGWIARCYGVRLATVAAEVVDAVWTGELRVPHRVAGIKPNNRRNGALLPSGLAEAGGDPFGISFSLFEDRWSNDKFEARIVADDWSDADVDRRNGTVGGWPQKNGVRERLLIEVSWEAAKAWAGPRVKRWRQDEGHFSAEPTAVAVTPALGLSRAGGRPRKWDWDAVVKEMMRLANTANGLPDRTNTTKHLLEWCMMQWGDEPGESTMREKVAIWYPD
jgi:hypothetical protein